MKTYSKALLGYRNWSIDSNKLVSIGFGKTAWTPGENIAICCSFQEHKAPVGSCHCGLYAYKDFETADNKRSAELNFITGAVAARGAVEVHATGFRAEQMIVLSLYSPTNKSGGEAIARDYGVPFFHNKKEFLKYNKQFRLKQLKATEPEGDTRTDMINHLMAKHQLSKHTAGVFPSSTPRHNPLPLAPPNEWYSRHSKKRTLQRVEQAKQLKKTPGLCSCGAKKEKEKPAEEKQESNNILIYVLVAILLLGVGFLIGASVG